MFFVRSCLLTLIPTLVLTAADAAPGLAVWDAGVGMVGTEPGAPGASIRPGTALVVGDAGPVRVILPGTGNGYLTLAAGSSVVLAERRIEGSGTVAAELQISISTGAVAVGGDLAPRFTAVRVRGGASETVAAPGVGVVVEADRVSGDTVVAIDGPVSTGPLPVNANGWQAVAERVILAPRTVVVVELQHGVKEPAAATGRPHLNGSSASRPSLRKQVTEVRASVDSWALDVATRDLGPANPAWWAAPPANPGATTDKAWSGLVQVSGFYDSNPNSVATELGGGKSDIAGSLFGDARWICVSKGDYSVRVQALGGLVRYSGVEHTDDLDVAHDSRDKDQRQAGVNAALIQTGQLLDWSMGVGGQAYGDGSQKRRAISLNADVGCQVADAYAVLNLGWSNSRVDPSTGDTADYTTQGVTARPAVTFSLPGTDWSSSVEVSLLYTDSRSKEPKDDFSALRPSVSWNNKLGRLDLGLAGRYESISYRAPRATTETLLARENVLQTTLTADWWTAAWWSVGLFGNYIRFDSNQPLADYTQSQLGARSTLIW